ncbi:GGDEF domain-containing protein, partial [Treponema sp. OttesenSCG-928-L16]|nr:GGDEF domain-containing protein [Treponema sp. OttesenSCG-928-L16]
MQYVYAILNLDTRSLIAVLFWGNLTSVALILSYRIYGSDVRDRKLAINYVSAKFLQAAAYLCIFFRDIAGDWISVSLGNSFIIMGFYFEALSMLTIIHDNDRLSRRLIAVFLVISLVSFNLIEIVHPDSALRIVMSSLGIFLILIVPVFRLFFAEGSSRFKRVVALYYTFFILFLLPRAVYALIHNDVNVFSNYFLQNITFLALVLLLIFSLSAYLLLMKENTDKLIHYMASTDMLSGISNRRYFLEAADMMFKEYRHEGSAVAMMFFDIDHFKKVNDTYGHSFGDEVIIRFAEIIKRNMRSSDLSCRYGGEEFLVFLRQNSLETARKIAERIMAEIKEIKFKEKKDFTFTVSAGIAWGIPEKNELLNDYIDQADQALYEA